ncbi:DUF4190 domain-containing protein [Actinoplanes regularis]|uniref:DUF4190 domain-containing protein n=1 Tax=Actinoplanes regularis TaxID=52697 RepID=UPI0024A37153|nr:DUF4190 domain-containing protein [Actinoplanes regularis]GLW34659.1 hypothetical protein Areg01_75960 [Actinoplanes regularis]
MDNPQSPPPGPYGPMYPQTATPASGWAVAALVLGIVSVLGGFCLLAIPCIGAVVCGHVGLADTRPGTNGGRSMAIAGLIMGYLGLLLALLLLLIGSAVLPDLPSTF